MPHNDNLKMTGKWTRGEGDRLEILHKVDLLDKGG